MSGAQHGYVDLSCADKGAADETDEVNLQMRCLTGEGVTLSVPRSMLVYDLRRLVSQKIPCKPGAKLTVHHVNGKLTLDQTLGEHGIVGKSVMLSRTYVPTNVYTAWRYPCGLQTCERALAIEGVAQLELVTGGEYLHHLPRSLARLTFLRFLQPKPRAGDFAIESSKPKPGASDLALPSSLQSLSFGRDFTERVTLPSNLQSSSFSNQFNQSLERVSLPSSLQCLSFGWNFNQSLERVSLPSMIMMKLTSDS